MNNRDDEIVLATWHENDPTWPAPSPRQTAMTRADCEAFATAVRNDDGTGTHTLPGGHIVKLSDVIDRKVECRELPKM